MRYLSTLVERFPIRRNGEQKDAFRSFIREEAARHGYACSLHSPKAMTDNIVIGDPLSAEVTFSAHYDTPANMLIPNLMIPRNLPLFLLYQIVLVLGMLLLSALVILAAGAILPDPTLAPIIGWLFYMALLLMMLFGPANKHNVNDNTSGVAAVLELMARIPEEKRSKVAFILFDNEEKGLVGSRAYAREHLEFQHTHLLINLDCVGVGEHLLVISPRLAMQHPAWAQLPSAFDGRQARQVHFFPKTGSACNSDHTRFKCGVAIIACKHAPVVGYYCDKIHTRQDTFADEENIHFLADALADYVTRL